MVRRIGTGCDSIGWNVLKLSHRLIDFFFLMEWIKNASIAYLQLRRKNNGIGSNVIRRVSFDLFLLYIIDYHCFPLPPINSNIG
jgi:hypothetical protein